MAEGKITAEANIEEQTGVEQKASYVLHGGKAYCEYGTRESRLQVPECHGTYIHDMPMMTYKDTEVKTNIQPFGYCMCMNNPDRAKKVEKILNKVDEETHDLLDTVMDGVNAVCDGVSSFASSVKGFFCGEEDTEKSEETTDEERTLLEQSVTIMCKPGAFSVIWEDASEDLIINKQRALTSQCTILCEKCGAVVSISDDGQENATFEQQSKQDMSKWQEGDPVPEASRSNLQQLEALGKEDTELYEKMKNQIEQREKLDKDIQYYKNKDQGRYHDLLSQRENMDKIYKTGKM